MRKTTGYATAAMAAVVVAILGGGCGSTGPTAAHSTETRSRTHPPALPTPFTISARYSARALGLDDASSLAIGSSGDLYVTDLSQRVTVISPAGQVLRRFGHAGRGPGEFRFVGDDPSDPTDIHAKIAVGSGGAVYVSDSGNARIEVFTAYGMFVRQFGRFGSGDGQFLALFDIAVDGAGNVYVVDDQRLTLRKFTPTGKTVWQVGGTGSPEPDLAGHLHLNAIDVHGRLVLANNDRARIVYVDGDGRVVDAFGSHGTFPGSVCEATVDAFGYTYVTGCGRGGDCPAVACGATLVFDRTHRLVAEWPGTNPALLRSPVFGPKGEVFTLSRDGSVLRLHVTLPRR